jgi:hypothetical protein
MVGKFRKKTGTDLLFRANSFTVEPGGIRQLVIDNLIGLEKQFDFVKGRFRAV